MSEMHNLLSRGNSLLAFTLWVMAAVTAACFFSTVFLDYTTHTKLTVNDIKLRSVVDYATDEKKVDLATLAFDLEADFTKVFNWNVKQVFVYLVAEYKSAANVSILKYEARREFLAWI
uniref:Signal peptidase complex subunit 3 n=1 Tax=Caenorhabditis japonica TaxID=281687 RepID=A0A8R1HUK2_CAEJA